MPESDLSEPLAETESKGRILVVDDEEDIRESLETLLTLEGYTIEMAVERRRWAPEARKPGL